MAIKCPYCQNVVEDSDAVDADVSCSTCGTSFRLEGHASTIPYTAEIRKVGRFELIAAVGRGAFGVVYKARDPELNRIVALKVPRQGLLEDALERDRFLREARNVAHLRHPSIVPVHEVGQENGTPFLVSEFIEGVTLADLLSSRRLGFDEAARLVATVSEALQFAHDRGVVHRDIKPSNIQIDGVGAPHVMDFGLARREMEGVSVTAEGQILGTPAFMSPEQARGEAHRVDGRSDIYSLGVIMYLILTGEQPFRGTPRMLMHQVLTSEVRRPRAFNDHIPRDLETICLKSMAKLPSERYQTAQELADDLRRYLRREPIRARPVGAWGRTWRWVRRHPTSAALVATSCVALLAVGGAAAGWLFYSRLHHAFVQIEQAQFAEAAARQGEKRFQYYHHIALAESSWRDGNMPRMRQLLDDCPIEFRNWEWRYLSRLGHADLRTLYGHTKGVLDVAFSPDGTQLATAGNDHVGRVWEVATGREILKLTGHKQGLINVMFAPDGRRLITSSGDATTRIWSLPAGQEVMTLVSDSHAASAQFDDNIQAGQQVMTLAPLTHTAAAFSPDGKRVATAGADGSIWLWDATTGEELRALEGHDDLVWAVAFSPDGAWLASASSDQTVRVWDSESGQLDHALQGHTGFVRGVAFSPDGSLLATAGADRTVRLWNAASGKLTLALDGHTSGVSKVAFSPDGTQVASASGDGTVCLWNIRDDMSHSRLIQVFKGHDSAVLSVAFSPDGKQIASASADSTVKLWDATSVPEQVPVNGASRTSRAVAVSPDGKLFASAHDDGIVRVWDMDTGQVVHRLEGHRKDDQLRQVSCLAFSPDGWRLVSGGWDDCVRIWDYAKEVELLTLRGHLKGITCTAIHPDGTKVASASGDRTLRVWDMATGQSVFTLEDYPDEVNSIAFSPNGQWLVVAAGSQVVKVNDAATGQELFELKESTEDVMSVVFNLDGSRLATGGWDQTTRIWDVANWRLAFTYRNHTEGVLGLAFNPAGDRLATASADHTIKLWDVNESQETITLTGHSNWVHGVAFSPDGDRLISVGADGAVKIWDGRPLQAVLSED